MYLVVVNTVYECMNRITHRFIEEKKMKVLDFQSDIIPYATDIKPTCMSRNSFLLKKIIMSYLICQP